MCKKIKKGVDKYWKVWYTIKAVAREDNLWWAVKKVEKTFKKYLTNRNGCVIIYKSPAESVRWLPGRQAQKWSLKIEQQEIEEVQRSEASEDAEMEMETITKKSRQFFWTRTKGKLSKRANKRLSSEIRYQAAKNRDVWNSRVNLSWCFGIR